jgi:O-antigen/teichoic acid export membrane protein
VFDFSHLLGKSRGVLADLRGESKTRWLASAFQNRQNRALLANSASLIANTFAGSFFGFLFWLVAARTYPQAEVGLGAAFISALTFLTTLGELGLGTALIRFAPTLGAQQARFVNSVLVAVGVTTAAVALVFALGTPLWSPDMAVLAHSDLYLGLFVGTALVFGLAQVLDRLFIAFGVTHFMLGRNLLANGVRLALVLTVSQWGGALGLLGAVGGGALVTFALAALVSPRARCPATGCARPSTGCCCATSSAIPSATTSPRCSGTPRRCSTRC